MRHLLVPVAAVLFIAVSASAQTAPDGAAVFQKACATCHAQPGPDSRAPTREVLRSVAPEAIVTALTVGNMFRQGSELTDAERKAVAAFLSGRPVGTPGPSSIVGNCTAKPAPLQASALDALMGMFDDDVTDMSTTVKETMREYYKNKKWKS